MAAKILYKISSRWMVVRRCSCCKEDEGSSVWNYFKKKSGEKKSSEEKPPLEQCRKSGKVAPRQDPDLSRFGGQPYRTCGPAYVIQKDVIPACEIEQSDEELTLKKMEAVPGTKDGVCDPMPPFRSVEQRMIDLTERKLHPFYKRYMELPKRDSDKEEEEMHFKPYRCKCGPVDVDDIPASFNFNKELLERKNIFADFKRVELPKQMVARIVEMEKNRKPTLEKKKSDATPTE